jgi:hypothetical protein
MAETLPTGLRRLPSTLDAAAATAVQTIPNRAALVDAALGAIDQVDTLIPLATLPASDIQLQLGNSGNPTTVSTEANRGDQGHRPNESRITVKYQADVPTGGFRRTSVVAQAPPHAEKAPS